VTFKNIHSMNNSRQSCAINFGDKFRFLMGSTSSVSGFS
jgi:hypothetical protein